ncbi:hypothetical protein [Geminicoccus flavidas]|uniref:hypothetical protein n=1 Tax=Geminicoccus flavidas TaxID=2506407 RepID=UPI00135BDB43|nr:hypothetical protein [Geminicoccus flavidas]
MTTQAESKAGRARTAATAVLAGTPGLGLTVMAATTSNALVVHADLLLSLLDMVALLTVWATVRSASARLKRAARHLMALSLVASLATVTWVTWERLTVDTVRLEGRGLWVAMILNGVYALINGWVLLRWRRSHRQSSCSVAASQIRLFADKLTSNVLIAGSLAVSVALDGIYLSRFIDPVAGLAMVTATAWWAAPTVLLTLCDLAGPFTRMVPQASQAKWLRIPAKENPTAGWCREASGWLLDATCWMPNTISKNWRTKPRTWHRSSSRWRSMASPILPRRPKVLAVDVTSGCQRQYSGET